MPQSLPGVVAFFDKGNEWPASLHLEALSDHSAEKDCLYNSLNSSKLGIEKKRKSSIMSKWSKRLRLRGSWTTTSKLNLAAKRGRA